MQGWIRVQCRSESGGGLQVCSEVITVGSTHEAVAGLANALVSLLIADLPIFLYWRSPHLADWKLVETLARSANLLIVDSQTLPAVPRDYEQLLRLLTGAARAVEIRDLCWSRLTAWRDLIAQCFDTRDSSRLLKELVEIEICFIPAFRDRIAVPALLLAGWLASRLDWHQISAEQDPGERTAHLRGPGGAVAIRFVPPSEDPAHVGVQRVTLRTRNGSTFSVVQDAAGASLTASSTGPSAEVIVHTVPCPSTKEADLLGGELMLPGEDSGFAAALAAAQEIERSLR